MIQQRVPIANPPGVPLFMASQTAAAPFGWNGIRLLIAAAAFGLALLVAGCDNPNDATPTQTSCPPGSDGCLTDADCGSPLLFCNESCNCVTAPLHVCSALTDGCATDADCPAGQHCNSATCNCCPGSGACTTDADCGANEWCAEGCCRCNGTDYGYCPAWSYVGSYCWTVMHDQVGGVTWIPVLGFCDQECQCCECDSDDDCGLASYCDPQTCHCELRPGCSTCSPACSGATECREVSGGGCACVDHIDMFGCYDPEYECVAWQTVPPGELPRRLWPGDSCTTPNGNVGVCDDTCDCVVDCTWNVCAGLEDGDPCYPVGGANSSSTAAGVCNDCACVCPEGNACAGRIDGWGCVISEDPYIYGYCHDCQCVLECAPDSDGCHSDADCGSPLLFCNESCNCVSAPLHMCSALSDGCMSDADCPAQHYCDPMCNCQLFPACTGGGMCAALEDGAPCYPVGGANSPSTEAGVCYHCACVCPEGNACAGMVDGWQCIIDGPLGAGNWGYCRNCQCLPGCTPDSDGCHYDADCLIGFCNESCNCIPAPLRMCSALSDGCMSDANCPDLHYCDSMCNCQALSPPPPLSPPTTGESGPVCGDGICQADENSDLCNQDCECVDNGTAEPSEGCNCADVLCEGEDPATVCGAPCPTGLCSGGLACIGGTCQDAADCSLDVCQCINGCCVCP
jgi:hypothetical protein